MYVMIVAIVYIVQNGASNTESLSGFRITIATAIFSHFINTEESTVFGYFGFFILFQFNFYRREKNRGGRECDDVTGLINNITIALRRFKPAILKRGT